MDIGSNEYVNNIRKHCRCFPPSSGITAEEEGTEMNQIIPRIDTQ